MEHVRAELGGLYTGAFILCATDTYGHKLKHRNHVELFWHMFCQQDQGARLLATGSLREVYQLLHGFPLMGDFMSYQTAIDLNYSAHITFSENDFTQPGPGALRGIRKAFEDLGDLTPQQIISWMVDTQAEHFDRLGIEFNNLYGRPLHAIDCQGLFCELDKYCRRPHPNSPAHASGSRRGSPRPRRRYGCSSHQTGPQRRVLTAAVSYRQWPRLTTATPARAKGRCGDHQAGGDQGQLRVREDHDRPRATGAVRAGMRPGRAGLPAPHHAQGTRQARRARAQR